MEIKRSLELLAKYAGTEEKFIIKYTTGRTYVAQFNSYGTLLLWLDKHSVQLGLVIIDHISEVLPIKVNTPISIDKNDYLYKTLHGNRIRIIFSNILRKLIYKLDSISCRVL